jgi:hypothetical protein
MVVSERSMNLHGSQELEISSDDGNMCLDVVKTVSWMINVL